MLIVKNERIIALDISNYVEFLGYSVIGIVSTGDEALLKTEETSVDLVLMDIFQSHTILTV